MIDLSQVQFPPIAAMGPVIIITLTVLVLILVDVVLRTARGKDKGISLTESVCISMIGVVLTLADTVYLWMQLVVKDAGGFAGRENLPWLVVAPLTEQAGVLAQLFVSQGPEMTVGQLGPEPSWAAGSLVIDFFALFVTVAVCVIVLLVALNLLSHVKQHKLFRAEVFPLLLISATGMMLLGMSRDLLITFIAIEILSLPLYVLCGLDEKREISRESSLKYFLLGAFASGFFIYGCALVYGMTTHLNYAAIAHYVTHVTQFGEAPAILFIGLALVGAGFAFKLALVPFHAWAPDVYQGAPTPITGFMAVGVKLAVFACVIRFIIEAILPSTGPLNTAYWRDGLIVFAILSMVVGNLLALHQMSAKRLLAFSAIAHTGYLAVGLVAATPSAAQSMLAYLVAYGLAGLGAFGIISYLAPEGQDDIYLDEMYELGTKAPVSAIALTILLLSMGGLPLTAGFIGKFLVFRDAWQAGLTGLVIIAVLNSVISFYYYLRFVLAMYMQPKAEGAGKLSLVKMPATYVISGLVTVGLTLLLGVLPRALIDLVSNCVIGQ